MKDSIMTILYHRAGQHSKCGDWCKGDDKNVLPQFVINEIKPIFEDLSSDNLLIKCLHGGTQNNESYHNLIWNRCPKTTFVGKERLELAVFDAVIVYKDGEFGRCDIFSSLGLRVGKFTIDGFRRIDTRRVKGSSVRYNKDRKKERQRKQQEQDIDIDEDTYVPGGF